MSSLFKYISLLIYWKLIFLTGFHCGIPWEHWLEIDHFLHLHYHSSSDFPNLIGACWKDLKCILALDLSSWGPLNVILFFFLETKISVIVIQILLTFFSAPHHQSINRPKICIHRVVVQASKRAYLTLFPSYQGPPLGWVDVKLT